MRRMRVIQARPNQVLHIETPLGIVNIRVGLTNWRGQPVDSIRVTPNAGVRLAGRYNTRLIGKKDPKK